MGGFHISANQPKIREVSVEAVMACSTSGQSMT